MDDWVKKMWYVYTMEHYSLIRKEILPFATTWMDPENILLSEISHTEKEPYDFIHMQDIELKAKYEEKRKITSQTQTIVW